MKRKVRITRMPNLKSGAEVKLEGLRAGLGFNANVMPWPIMAGKMSEPDFEVKSTLQPVPREEANLEAEKDEIALLPGDGGIPDTFRIGGKRHYEGGTPLNLPDESFIFSDTAKMRIKDPAILAQFGMSIKKGGYTPADIAKKYNINQYKKILLDPNSDDLQRDTAEQMITNYNLKLAKLALVQESMKGFPQGLPAVSTPYLESLNIDPSVFVEVEQQQQEDSEQTMAYGGLIGKLKMRKEGGAFDMYNLPRAQDGQETGTPAEVLPGFSTFGLLSSKESNIQSQLDFMQGSAQNKAIYENFKDAFKSNNPDLMRDVANKIRTMNAGTWSWDVIPWSDQDKYEDLSTILFERAKELRTPTKKTESKYDIYSKKLNDLQNFYISKRDKYSPSTLEYYQYNEKLNTLSNYKKDVETVNEPAYIYEQGLLSGRGLPYDEIDAMHYEVFKKPAKKASAPKQQTDVKVKNKGSIGDTTFAQTQLQNLETTAPADSTTVKVNKTPQNVTTSQSISNQNTSNDNTALDSIYVIRNGKLVREKATFEKKLGGELNMYQVGGSKKPVDYIYDEDTDRVRPLYDTKGDIGDPIDIEEEITQEQYDELEKLRQEMIAEVGDDMTKESDKVTAFQKKYHEYLPEKSRLINMKTKFRTAAGKKANKPLSDPSQNVDKYRGPITKQYEAGLRDVKIKKPASKQESKKDLTKGTLATTQKASSQPSSPYVEHLENLKYADTRAPWWLQDIIKTANAAGDYATVQRYNPWQATTPIQTIQPVYYDPERELAANEEQANAAMQVLSQFAGPQAFNARQAEIQGRGAKAAADVLGRYNSLNVGIANKVNEQNANLMNQAAALRAAEQTGLYDKYTIAKQQFDNAKRQAKNALINQYVQGITNRAYTQALNSLYPQFAVDSSRGGMAIFHDPRSFKPSSSKSKTYQDYVTEAIAANPQLKDASAAEINK